MIKQALTIRQDDLHHLFSLLSVKKNYLCLLILFLIIGSKLDAKTAKELALSLNCPANISTSVDSGLCEAVVSWPAISATGDTSALSISSNFSSGMSFPEGNTTIVYTATNGNGEQASCSFDVLVEDTEAPIFSFCPASITQSAASASCGRTVAWNTPLASDNCSAVSINGSHSSGSFFPLGTTTVQFVATDANGNTSLCSFDISIEDNSPPSVSGCPSDITIMADSTCTATASWNAILFFDNCSSTNISNNYFPGSSFPLGSTEVVYAATDAVGNSSNCSFYVHVESADSVGFAYCPDDMTVYTDSTQCDAVATWPTPTASNACSFLSLSSNYSSGSTFSIGTTTVSYTLTDASAATATCSFFVQVIDSILPQIICPTDTSVSTAIGFCEASVSLDAPSVFDNCITNLSNNITGTSSASGTYGLGETLIVYTATDASGNTTNCSFRLNVLDGEPPSLFCGGSVVERTGIDSCSAYVTVPQPLVLDNCTTYTLTNDRTGTNDASDVFPLDLTSVVWTFTDAVGNTATCTQNIVIQDLQAPSIDCIDSVQANINAGSCEGDVVVPIPTVSDNCGIQLIINTSNGTADASDTYDFGTTLVNWIVFDQNGNTAGCLTVIEVVGDEVPVLENCPSDTTVSGDENCEAIVGWSSPIATDNCGLASLSSNYSPDSTLSYGTTQVVYTATDAQGNTAICSFNVTVADSVGPIFDDCPANISQVTGSSCDSVVVSWAEPLAVDACSGLDTVMSSHLSGSIFPVGITDVSYVASDENGNTTSCSFEVSVSDNQAPAIISCSDQSVSVDNGGCEASTFPAVAYVDNCNAANVSYSPSGPYAVGSHFITATVTDDGGNSASCSFNLSVSADLSISGLQDTLQLCPGENYTISPIVNGGSGNYEYEWRDNLNQTLSTNAVFSLTPDTNQFLTYVFEVDDTQCGGSIQDTIYLSSDLINCVSCLADPYESNDDLLSATPLPKVGINKKATICQGDEDWYSYQVEAGPFVTFQLTGLPANYQLRLYDQNGTALDSSMNAGNSSESIEIATNTGEQFYLQVYGENDAYDAEAYSLKAIERSVSANLSIKDGGIRGEQSSLASTQSAFLYPNPNSGEVFIRLIGLEAERGNIRLYDLSGKLVYADEWELSQNEPLRLDEIAAGMYFYDLQIGEYQQRGELILVE